MQEQITNSTQPTTFRKKCLELLTDITPSKGIKFEQLVVSVLPRIEVLEVEDAWRWTDVPSEVKSNLFPHDDGQDTGIDVLARRFDSSYVALQLKCYQANRVLKQSDISSFLAKTGGHSRIARRMIVATCRFSRNISKGYADCTLIHAQSDPDWANVPISADASVHKPKELDTLQRRALRNVVRGLAVHDRGQLIMACGTGKTLVSQRVAESIVPNGGTVLYATPSIGLTAQSRREWIANSKTAIRTVVVCSDVTAGRGGPQTGRLDEIEAPVSTDPRAIAKAVNRARLSLPNGQGIVSIFSTYQSMDRIVEAQRLTDSPLPEFDLAVADEAHRTTGGRSKNKTEGKTIDGTGVFQLIHDKVAVRKRLYQTATPRIYSRRTTRKTINEIVQWEQSDVEVIDMSDERFYGPELERISFSEALAVENEDERRLCDYRVMIATVSDDYGAPVAETAQAVKNTSMSIRLASLSLALHGMKAKFGGGGGRPTFPAASRFATR